MAQNRMHVRKYYERNRDQIIRSKIERACKLEGRVPRAQTIRAHSVPVETLVAAFKEWLVTEPIEARRTSRISRLRSTIAQVRTREDFLPLV